MKVYMKIPKNYQGDLLVVSIPPDRYTPELCRTISESIVSAMQQDLHGIFLMDFVKIKKIKFKAVNKGGGE